MLTLPTAAQTKCRIPVLPDNPTMGDLEAVYLARGEALAICDGRRDLAVQSFDAQQRAITPPVARPFWKVW